MVRASLFSVALLLLMFSELIGQSSGSASRRQTQADGKGTIMDLPDRETQFKEYTQPNLPSLNVLIQTALENSPMIKQQEAMVTMREWQKKSAQIDWSRYLELFTEGRWGTYDYVVFGGATAPTTPPSTMRYNVGTRIQLNLFDALDQNKKVKVAESILDFEKAKVEEAKRVIIDEVIKQYNQVITYREIVKIKSDNLQSQIANRERMEMQFAGAEEDLMEYARITEIATKAQEEFELAKKEFRVAYMLLENLVGVQLDQLNGQK